MADDLLAGRYRLLERHAVGGMATVWRARDERTGETVAVKQLHPYLLADDNARARLEREAAALRLLDHHAIVRPRALVDDLTGPALVMDFATGRSLAERIADDGAMPPDEAVAMAATIADALAVAHRAGILHRDVKPANVLVEDSGAVHLVDFGIASLAEGVDMTLTTSGTMVGTLRYAAPERLAGAGASPRSDVWSLGAVLYEMLVGRPAVPGDDPATIVRGAGAILPALAGVRPALASIVSRAMSPDPQDRYPDAGAFRDALEALDVPVDADARTVVIPLRPAVRESTRQGVAPWLSPVDRAASVFFAGVAAVMLIVMAVAAMGGPNQASLPPAPAEPSVIATPAANGLVATTPPDEDDADEDGNGRGRGKGKGKDNKD